MEELSCNQITSSGKKKKKNGGWKSAIFIIFVEMAERFAYYGVAGNLIVYLTTVVRQPTATAAKNVNIWRGISSLFPIVGGFLADSYFGRYNTVVISTLIYLMGLVLLTISVSSEKLRDCHAFFFVALYTLSVGEGGHKPCVQTFAADQFDENLPKEKEAKSSFFNWWYLGIVLAATVATLVLIYVEDKVGWLIGYTIPTVAVAVALALFLVGTPTYRKQAPVGSPLTRVAQVFVAAAKKWDISDKHGDSYYENGVLDVDPPPPVRPLARTNQFRFLDKAALIDEIDKSSKTIDPWRLCSVNQVEEVKIILRLIPIWLSNLMFSAVIVQLGTFFTKQGSTMIRTIGHIQVPPASLQVIPGITILIAVPMYDRLLVPFARKITGQRSGITMLQRIGIGLFLSMLIMVAAALTEAKRVQIAKTHGLINQPKSVVPVRVWWLLPQYILCGLSDVFAVVGLQELFYDQVPEQMRSMGAAAYLSLLGVGSFLSSALISVVQAISSRFGEEEWLNDNLNKAHLDYFYWVLAGLSAVNLCVYVLVAKGFVYRNNDCHESDTTGTKLELGM